jgi:hypothetical protein
VSVHRGTRLGVIVLGMHRSGTSAASRLLNLLGFSLGPDDDLVPARDSNPAGHWENASLNRLNRRILEAVGGHGSAPPPMPDGWQEAPELEPLRRQAADLARTVLAEDQWAWKDPRTCLTAPFWLGILDAPLALVLVHRNPLEVAASLEARDGRPVPLGLATWERYVRSALAAARGRPVYVAAYEELVGDPVGWCERVAAFLRSRGAEVGAVPAEEVRSFVRPDLRHTELGVEALESHPAVSEQLRAVYAAVRALAGAHASFEPPELPPETPWVEPLFAERRRALADERALRHAERDARRAEAKLARIESSRGYWALDVLRTLRRRLARGRASRSQAPT